MPEYSEQDLKYAAQLREEIHNDALERVRAVYPLVYSVIDKYPVDSYFQEVWDYPGKWYTVVGTPPGTGGRKELTESIARDTLEYLREAGAVRDDGAFYRMIARFPDNVCDYRIVNADDPRAETAGVFPYRGTGSHRLALEFATRDISKDGDRAFDAKTARCRKISGKALFAPVGSDSWLNYRKAFLCPPHGNSYTDRDFDRFNAVLFPGGAEGLEVFRWTADLPDCSDGCGDPREALCLTVYDRSLDRFVVITAPAAVK